MTYRRARATVYAGIRMRSRLEASFAAWLDQREFTWRYEPRCFASSDGQYLPDFQLITLKGRPINAEAFFEVKPPNADMAAALDLMHIIRATHPNADLHVVTSHSWPEPRFEFARQCLPSRRCLACYRYPEALWATLLDETAEPFAVES